MYDSKIDAAARRAAFLNGCVARITDDERAPAGVDVKIEYGPRCFAYVALDLADGRSVMGTTTLFENLGIDPKEAFAAALARAASKPVKVAVEKATLLSAPVEDGEGREFAPALVEYSVSSDDGSEPSFAFASPEGLRRTFETVGGPFAFVLPILSPAYVAAGNLDLAVAKCVAVAEGAFGRPVLGGHAFAFDGENLSAIVPQ